MAASSKVKLLRVLDILRETDETNPYTANEIVKQLSLYGIEAERKSVLRDIATLQDYGYDILLHPDNKRGYYMASREFEDWELKILMDAAVSANFLTQDNSRRLADKISSLASKSGQKALRTVTPLPSQIKHGDPTTKIAIDLLLKAIREKKMVRFQYTYTGVDLKQHFRFEGHAYPVHPYALIWRQDRYYLIGAYGQYRKLSYYRLDRIRNLKIQEELLSPIESILGPNADKKLIEFVDQNIYNHGGDATTIRLDADRNSIELLVDTFGDNVRIEPKQDGRLLATAKVNDGFGLELWLLQHGDFVQIIEPLNIRQKVLQLLDEIRENYVKLEKGEEGN